jgi:hypothetical protein
LRLDKALEFGEGSKVANLLFFLGVGVTAVFDGEKMLSE